VATLSSCSINKMKRFLSVILLLNVLAVQAQEEGDTSAQSHYLLRDFTLGKVYLKGGEVNPQVLNYNGITNEMVFRHNGGVLAIANPQDVDSVVISDRVFMYTDKKFYERLTVTQHPLFRELVCQVEMPGVNTGFGTTSTNTAATSLRTIYGNSIAYDLKLPDGVKVRTKQVWWLKTEKGYQKFANEQQLKKILTDKKDQISEYVKKNNTRFSKQEELVALIRHIDQ
jgi:hypothetical protein